MITFISGNFSIVPILRRNRGNSISMIKKRYLWLDIARLIAIFCVVFNHVNENLNQNPTTSLTIILQLIGRTGVPLFLIISGYLMLNRDYTRDGKMNKFIHHNMLPMVYSTILWTFLLSLYTYFILNNKSIALLLQNLIFQNRPMPQMWYIQLLPVIYVLIPVLSIAKKFFTRYVGAIFLVGTALLGISTLIANFTKNKFVPFQWNMSGSWGLVFIMLSLLVFGSYLNEISKSKSAFILLGIGTLISFILFIINTKQLSPAGIMPTIWYTQVWVFLPGSFIILIIKKFDPHFENFIPKSRLLHNSIPKLSNLTFGVYIVHYAFLHCILSLNIFHAGFFNTMLLSLLALVISFIFVWVVTKIPKLPSFVFLTK